jgi:hypothetical protein
MRAQVPRGDGVHHNNPEDSLPFLCFAAAQKLPKKQDLVSKKKGSFVNSTETPLHVRSRPASPHPLQSQEFNERKTSSGLVPFAASEINK